MTVDILAFGAHPDDVEIGAGGTLLKHAKSGKTVGICDLTYAELSSNGDVSTRQGEAKQAARILQLSERHCLGIPDRNILINEENIRKVVQVIRKCKPRTILAPYWEDRHPDHEHCSHLVREAVFSAGIRKFAPEAGEAHKVTNVFYYFINDFVDPDFCVDISSEYDAKMAALESYKSQFELTSETVETPLNTGYFAQVRSREYLFGRKIGTGFAEGFKSRGQVKMEYFG
ncbi:bacillithiol biosynthesis deacetylase BshB1 [Ammoniphilus resinae]|uniref:Bacillithiol biosynthesis deacetylase BshB1 n=1 Tax=Ammoniphilus resinae TaxID=861532 RepID=A0ABS4GTN9_9BACL|nr:bacillithiol biosynthesis deacetylase BshB1 [Ammoniphilus resinae]MBP1933412.1 bacillithiol biosynthesis deacetylase BshB1 [Ammoniphilus resinae]